MLVSLALVLALGNAELDEARELFKSLHYTEALPKLKRATESRGLSASERRDAYDLLARAWAAEGDMVAAQAAYGDLLAKDPMAPPPADAAPKLREAYRAAKAALYPPGTVRLTRRSATSVELFDPWGAVERIDVHVGGRTHQLKPAQVIEIKSGASVEAHGTNGATLAVLASVSDAPERPRPSRPRPDRTDSTSDTVVAQADPQPTASPSQLDPAPPPPPAVIVMTEPKSTWRAPATIGFAIAAVVQGAIAFGVGFAAQNDANAVLGGQLKQAQSYAIRDRQHVEAIAADTLMVTAGLTAIVALFVFILGPTGQE